MVCTYLFGRRAGRASTRGLDHRDVLADSGLALLQLQHGRLQAAEEHLTEEEDLVYPQADLNHFLRSNMKEKRGLLTRGNEWQRERAFFVRGYGSIPMALFYIRPASLQRTCRCTRLPSTTHFFSIALCIYST